jgi:DNA-binding NarL/FixJ family response regulator
MLTVTQVDENTILNPLTPRERDVLELLAEGLTNAEIAERLCIGDTTVRTYMHHLFAKLNVRNRTEAALVIWRAKVAAAENGR